MWAFLSVNDMLSGVFEEKVVKMHLLFDSVHNFVVDAQSIFCSSV